MRVHSSEVIWSIKKRVESNPLFYALILLSWLRPYVDWKATDSGAAYLVTVPVAVTTAVPVALTVPVIIGVPVITAVPVIIGVPVIAAVPVITAVPVIMVVALAAGVFVAAPPVDEVGVAAAGGGQAASNKAEMMSREVKITKRFILFLLL